MIEVRVPDIGELNNIPVIEILVKPGDEVRPEQPIVTLESDKATLDIPSPVGGRVAEIAVQAGSRVSLGTLLLTLEAATEVGSPEAESPSVTPKPQSGATVSVTQEAVATEAAVTTAKANAPATVVPQGSPAPVDVPLKQDHSGRIYASPSVRRLGRELGANLAKMNGSGPRGRIMTEDVHKSVREELQGTAKQTVASIASLPKTDFAKYGDVERMPLSRIRRLSGAALARNWAEIPHVTNFHEADVTDLEEFRVGLNRELHGDPKITLLAFIVKACAATLQRFPAFNASVDGQDVILKKYVGIGVAVDTPDGLVVPVIRDADGLGIIDIARAMSAKSASAQAGKLKSTDFEGGTFTITSLGGLGGTGFTPIINAPEIAILGVARATMQPRWDGSLFQPRLVMPLCLSWDHRALDGVAAARFLVHLVALLEDFRRAVL